MEKTGSNRRGFLRQAAALGAGAVALPSATLAQAQAAVPPERTAVEPRLQAPDLNKLPWKWDHGVKVFHLVAEPVKRELIPGKVLDLWGYNGSAPGPVLEADQGDRVRIVLDNHLPEPTSIHWHGLEVPNDMDGMPGISQPYIVPGGRYVYEFNLHQEGTYFYHSHMAMQEMMGLIGPLILHPRRPYTPPIDQDFVIVLQEYAALPGNPVPNTMSMEFNWLTMNGKSAPATTPLVVRLGQRVKIRLINMGMDGHPIHLHGMEFWLTGTEGGRQPESNWIRRNTVWVAVAQAWDLEFLADNPGNWMFHCHLPHHMMNQMASSVGPMTLPYGTPVGIGMRPSMGMPSSGDALSPAYGPSLGRGTGFASNYETPVANGPQSLAAMAAGMPAMAPPGPQAEPHSGQAHQTPAMPGMSPGHTHGMPPPGAIAKDANQVPGFPQAAFMEGPQMNMDQAVAKPETYGLRPGWSGFMGGMMTLVRVLHPDLYDKIQQLRREGRNS